jgi:hypothetical protein
MSGDGEPSSHWFSFLTGAMGSAALGAPIVMLVKDAIPGLAAYLSIAAVVVMFIGVGISEYMEYRANANVSKSGF